MILSKDEDEKNANDWSASTRMEDWKNWKEGNARDRLKKIIWKKQVRGGDAQSFMCRADVGREGTTRTKSNEAQWMMTLKNVKEAG